MRNSSSIFQFWGECLVYESNSRGRTNKNAWLILKSHSLFSNTTQIDFQTVAMQRCGKRASHSHRMAALSLIWWIMLARAQPAMLSTRTTWQTMHWKCSPTARCGAHTCSMKLRRHAAATSSAHSRMAFTCSRYLAIAYSRRQMEWFSEWNMILLAKCLNWH